MPRVSLERPPKLVQNSFHFSHNNQLNFRCKATLDSINRSTKPNPGIFIFSTSVHVISLARGSSIPPAIVDAPYKVAPEWQARQHSLLAQGRSHVLAFPC